MNSDGRSEAIRAQGISPSQFLVLIVFQPLSGVTMEASEAMLLLHVTDQYLVCSKVNLLPTPHCATYRPRKKTPQNPWQNPPFPLFARTPPNPSLAVPQHEITKKMPPQNWFDNQVPLLPNFVLSFFQWLFQCLQIEYPDHCSLYQTFLQKISMSPQKASYNTGKYIRKTSWHSYWLYPVQIHRAIPILKPEISLEILAFFPLAIC